MPPFAYLLKLHILTRISPILLSFTYNNIVSQLPTNLPK